MLIDFLAYQSLFNYSMMSLLSLWKAFIKHHIELSEKSMSELNLFNKVNQKRKKVSEDFEFFSQS